MKGEPVPEEMLVLYISPNPRDLIKATKSSLKDFADLITKPYSGYNPQSTALSNIQASGGKNHYFDMDFDVSDDKVEETKLLIEQQVNPDALTFVRTYGGFHVLIKLDSIEKTYNNSWYKAISGIEGCDVKGTDGLLPVVGCVQ